MLKTPKTVRLVGYGVAVLAPVVCLLVRLAIDPQVLDQRALYITFTPAVALAAYLGGFRTGLLATVVSMLLVQCFLIHPLGSFQIHRPSEAIALVFFGLVGIFMSVLSELLHRSRARTQAGERRYAVTLASIGDAVIATDAGARVTFLNPAAEALTGWSLADAAGRQLADVFRIINEETRQPAEDPAAKVLRTGTVVGLANHTALLARDGRETPIDDCGAPIIDEQGAVAGVVLVFRDVTQRRRAEEAEALRASEARFRALVQNSSDIISVFDAEGTVAYQSPSIERLLGYRPEDRIGHNVFSDPIVHPDSMDAKRVFFDTARSRSGGPVTAEFRLRHADGSWREIEAVGQNFLNDPDVKGIVANYRDITERKRAEEALRASEQRFRVFVDHSADAFLLTDEQGRVLDVNRRACEARGCTRDELIGRPPYDFVADLDPTVVEDRVRRLLAGETIVFEDRYRRRDGSVFPVEVRAKAFWEGDRAFIVYLPRDVTERKQVEERLRESEQRWRSLTEALPQLVWSATPDGSCDYFSSQWTEHTGVPEPDLLGWRWLETLHPDDREPTRKFWLESVAEHHLYDIEYRVRRRDGEYRWFKTRGVPIRDSNGAINKWFGTCTDITDLRQTQEALRQANARLDLAVRGSNISIWECDMPDGRIENSRLTLANVWELLGYDAPTQPADFPSAFALLFQPDDQERVGRELHKLFASDRQEYESEYRVLRKDGAIRWHLARGTVVRDPNGTPVRFIGTSTDITELKRAEEALRQANARVELAVRSSNISIWEQDMPDGRIENAHLNFFNVWESLGYDARTMPTDFSSACAVFFHPGDQERVGREIQELLASDRQEWKNEYRVRAKDGSTRWLLARGTVLRDPDGKPVRLIGASTDITDRKRAEEAVRQANARVDLAVRSSNIGIWECDIPDGHIENSSVTVINVWEMLGYEAPTMPANFSAGFARCFHPDDAERAGREMKEFLAGDGHEWENEFRVLSKDGSTRWHLSRGTVVRTPEGKPVRFIGASADITDRKRAEAALRESEERFRQLAENVRGVFWLQEDEWQRLLYISPVYEEFWGRTCQSLYEQPRSWIDSVHPEDRSLVLTHFDEQNRGASTETDFRITRPDGSMRWMRCRAFPLKNQAGEVYRVGGLVEDITEARQFDDVLRESEERFRGTFENAAVGIVHNDSAGRFLRVNGTYCGIVGYSRDELLQKTIQDIIHPDDLAAFVELYASCFARGEPPPSGLEKRYLRKDGSTAWVEAFISFQRDASGRPAYAIAAVQDVSERKRLDEELRRAKAAAEAANRAKDEFLANVSHEIRTPMNAILGMTELVLDTPLTDDQRQNLGTVKSAADNLLGIINDLLEFSKIEAGKLELVPADFSLRAVIGGSLRALAVRAHRKGIELIHQVRPDVPDALVGDAGRLRQVLLNLVGNAIKFTDDGEVEVRVEAVSGGVVSGEWSEATTDYSPLTTHLRFTVRDTGIGIPKDQQQRIFRAFEQEDTSTTRRYGGTGLGLTIAEQLVALMGGTITVESEPGRGSTFAFTARFGTHPAHSEPVSAGALISLHDLPVLVVDDNATNRQILEEWLRDWQMQPAAVGDAAAATTALRQAASGGRPYPLVLLDARMPDVDGLALAEQLRHDSELSATRIILLTSGDRPGDAARARELRIDAHLLKPVQQDELLGTIRQVMGREKVSGGVVSSVLSKPSAPTTQHSPLTTPLNILVAEDNEFNAELLEQLLGRRGHRVRVAGNGREALALTETEAFDLLLLDIHMPELDGFQVVQEVRQRERTTGDHLPIIALTARSRQADRDRCLAAGMDDFLAKPIQAADLWTTIDRLMDSRQQTSPQNNGSLDAQVLWAACGGEEALLEIICQAFRTGAPLHVKSIEDALRDQDAPHLREAAHKFSGMIAAFSTEAGQVASNLEDQAAAGQLEACRPLAEQLVSMASQLLPQLDGLTIDALRGPK